MVSDISDVGLKLYHPRYKITSTFSDFFVIVCQKGCLLINNFLGLLKVSESFNRVFVVGWFWWSYMLSLTVTTKAYVCPS